MNEKFKNAATKLSKQLDHNFFGVGIDATNEVIYVYEKTKKNKNKITIFEGFKVVSVYTGGVKPANA